jgi:EpsI family protein
MPDKAGWRPLYRNGLTEQQVTYRGPVGQRVDAFVAVYGLGATAGAEMISFNNVLFEQEHKTLPDITKRDVSTGDGRSWRVREVRVPDPAGTYLVWHWYMIGDRAVTNPFQVKFLEALAWITRNATTERSVTLATPMDDQAHERLQSFVDAHPACVASGFAAKACGE